MDQHESRREDAVWMKAIVIIAYVGLTALAALGLGETTGPFWPATVFLLLALPAGIFSAYLATLRRIHWLTLWSADSLAVRWLSGPWLRLLVACLLAFVAAALLSVRLSVAGELDFALMAGCAAFVLVLTKVLGIWLQAQFNPIYRHGRSLFIVAVLSAALMSVVDPAVRFSLVGYTTYASVEDAIQAVRDGSDWLGSSALSDLAVSLGSSWVGLERYSLGQLLAQPGWVVGSGLLAMSLLKFSLYLAVSFSVCACLLPGREYRRILQPSRSEEWVESPSPGRIALTSATLTIVVLFIYFPLVAVIEGALQNRAEKPAPELAVARAVELIGGQAHSVGTIEQVSRLAVSMVEAQHDVLGPIDAALTAGFARMREGVDPYLDWYYSLPGEWSRLAMLLTGNFEKLLADRLAESLGMGEPFAQFEHEFAAALEQQAEQRDRFRASAAAILEASRVELAEGDHVDVVAQMELDALLDWPIHSGLTTIEQRLGLTAATTGISGVVAAAATRQVLVRVATRGTIRSASQAIFRLATIRAGSAGGGGALGGLLGGVMGSVVPGIGTAIGAGIGGVVGGLMVGVGAEFLILKLEELWARDRHRAELLDAIDEAESRLRAQFGL